jgi:hypothetical protein
LVALDRWLTTATFIAETTVARGDRAVGRSPVTNP